MKPLYCLELPVLPERRGPPLFTRSHTYALCVIVYSIVRAFVASTGFTLFLLSGLTVSSWHWASFPSFHLVQRYNDELDPSLAEFWIYLQLLASVSLLPLDMSWVVLVFII